MQTQEKQASKPLPIENPSLASDAIPSGLVVKSLEAEGFVNVTEGFFDVFLAFLARDVGLAERFFAALGKHPDFAKLLIQAPKAMVKENMGPIRQPTSEPPFEATPEPTFNLVKPIPEPILGTIPSVAVLALPQAEPSSPVPKARKKAPPAKNYEEVKARLDSLKPEVIPSDETASDRKNRQRRDWNRRHRLETSLARLAPQGHATGDSNDAETKEAADQAASAEDG